MLPNFQNNHNYKYIVLYSDLTLYNLLYEPDSIRTGTALERPAAVEGILRGEE